ncbi:MAG: cyclic nucleotide-binding domain-containing protein [Candidatus Omnitrophota bacterium]
MKNDKKPEIWQQMKKEMDLLESVFVKAEGVSEYRVSDRAGKKSWVLKNEPKETYLTIDEKNFFIWNIIDGSNNVSIILSKYLEKYGSLGMERVAHFLNDLRNNYFLKTTPAGIFSQVKEEIAKRSSVAKLNRWRRTIAVKKVEIRHLDNLLSWLFTPYIRIFSTKSGKLWLVLAGIAGFIFFILTGTQGLYTPLKLLNSYALGFITIILANLAGSFLYEGSYAAYFKALKLKPRKSGLGFYLGLPNVFLDKRDRCLMDNQVRMRLTWAGFLIQFGFAGLLSIISLAVRPADLTNQIIFTLTLVCYLRIFIQFSPLLDLDGYRLLKDWFNVENLRRRTVVAFKKDLRAKFWREEKLSPAENGYLSLLFSGLIWIVATTKIFLYLIKTKQNLMLEDLVVSVSAGTRIGALFALSILLIPLTIFFVVIAVLGVMSLVNWLVRRPLWRNARQVSPLLLAGSLVLISIHVLFPKRWDNLYLISLSTIAVILTLWLAGWIFHKNIAGRFLVFPLLVVVLTNALPLFPPLLIAATGFLVFLLPNLKTYRGSKLNVYWWMLFLALLSLLKGGWIVATNPSQQISANTLFTLSFLLVLCSFLNYYLVHRYGRLSLPAGFEPGWWDATSDRERLQKSFSFSALSLLHDVADFYGRRTAELVKKRFNCKADKENWPISITETNVEHRGFDASVMSQIVTLYQQSTTYLVSSIMKVTGKNLVERMLLKIHDTLPWEDREVFEDYVISKLGWLQVPGSSAKISTQERREFLSRTLLFRHLAAEDTDKLSSLVKFETCRPGQEIIKQGQKGDKFYLIWKGRAEVIYENLDGNASVVAYLEKGDYFGEEALLKNVQRNATVRGMTEVELLSLDRNAFESFLGSQFRTTGNLREGWEDLQFMSDIPLFQEFSMVQISSLSSKFRVEKHPNDALIIKEGEMADKFYLVKEGILEVIRRRPDGSTEKVSELSAGEYFGEIALVFDVPRTATVKSKTAVTLLTLTRENFSSLLGNNPFITKKIERVSSRRIHELKKGGY